MERYFLGNNTAYGFVGNYDTELANKKKVVLLKGGPGTGKSTILKRIANEAKNRGFDYELWYCSGDPSSLDGVYIKDLNVAVVDATAPHATGANLPVIKDVIVDLATSLKEHVITPHKDEIIKLIKCKKQRFMRAYQHLKLALCHFENQIALEWQDVCEPRIRRKAAKFADELKGKYGDIIDKAEKARRVFVRAICPYGESEYFDHLKGKKIVKVEGGELATNVFFDELRKFVKGMEILNPLEPKNIDGIVVGDVAVVKDVGLEKDYDEIRLEEYEHAQNDKDITDERNGVAIEKAFAVEELSKAREYHMELEKYFVSAMDFEHNEKLANEVLDICFG